MIGLTQTATLKERLLFLLKDSAFYTVIATISRLTQLILFPIIARLLTPSEFGLTDVTWVFIYTFVPIVVLGQSTAIGRYYYDVTTSDEKKRVVFNGLIIQIIPIVIIVSGLLTMRFWISKVLFGTEIYGDILLWAIFSIPFLSIQDNVLNILKYTFRKTKFAMVATIPTIFVPLLTVLLVWWGHYGVQGVVVAWLFGYGLSSITGLVFVVDLAKPSIELELIKKLLILGSPLIVTFLIPVLLPTIDRFFVLHYLGLTMMGIYGVANKVAKLPYFLVASFNVAYGPYVLATHKHHGAEESYTKVLNYVVFGLSALVLGIMVFGKPLIVVLASAKYINSYNIMWPLLFAIIFRGASTIVGMNILISNRTVYFLIGGLLQILVVVGMDIWLIPHIKLLGAGLAILIGEISFFVLTARISSKLSSIKYQYNICLLLIGICFAATLVVMTTNRINSWLSLIIGFILWSVLVVSGIRLLFSNSQRKIMVQKVLSSKLFKMVY